MLNYIKKLDSPLRLFNHFVKYKGNTHQASVYSYNYFSRNKLSSWSSCSIHHVPPNLNSKHYNSMEISELVLKILSQHISQPCASINLNDSLDTLKIVNQSQSSLNETESQSSLNETQNQSSLDQTQIQSSLDQTQIQSSLDQTQIQSSLDSINTESKIERDWDCFDTVELVLKIESTFDISISDSVADSIKTPQNAIDASTSILKLANRHIL